MDTQKQLYDLIKDFKTAMLVTHGGGGSLHARPMAVAELKPDADMFFATGLGSPKLGEIQGNADVLVTFQGRSEYATISGTATTVRDKATIDRLWSEAWRAWFPNGKDDPSLCLLKVSAAHAEYWDNSGLEGIKYAFEGLTAIFQGRKPKSDETQHAKVTL
jgi:general stress protein 26